ncbi:MAG: hypothetical protein WBG71_14235 [Leeuwenhoekiella sp.]
MRQLINFSDKNFKSKQKWNSKTAKLIGGFDEVRELSPEDLEYCSFKNPDFLKNKGYGFYFWKPQIFYKKLQQLQEGDYLAYADSGSFFVKSVNPLITYMEEKQSPFLFYKLPLIERQWTKRDSFMIMDCDTPEFTDTPQISASFFIMKKCKESLEFTREWLSYCEDVRIIGDGPNTAGKPNYPEYINHRFDQSALSLMVKKWRINPVSDITDYGVFPRMYYHEDRFLFDKSVLYEKNAFGGIILHNRKKSPLSYAAKYYIRRLVGNFGFKIGHDKTMASRFN